MKKYLFVFIIITIFLSLPIAYSKGISFISSLQGHGAYISVKELKGDDIVYIDGKDIAKTPMINQVITSGTHEIKIVRSQNQQDYYTFDKQLTFEKDTNSVITLQLGPSYIYTFYNILTFTKSNLRSGIVVNAEGYNKQDSSLTLKNQNINANEVINQTPGTYMLTYKKDGYIGINNDITLNDGYILEETVHLFKQPI